jgi:hypothetical protein
MAGTRQPRAKKLNISSFSQRLADWLQSSKATLFLVKNIYKRNYIYALSMLERWSMYAIATLYPSAFPSCETGLQSSSAVRTLMLYLYFNYASKLK